MGRSFPCFVALLGALAACGQGGGEPCFQNDDCRGSLVCCPEGRDDTTRGTCEGSCEPMPPQDMGQDAGQDMGVDLGVDLGIDMGPPPVDMGPMDQGAAG